MLLSGLRSIAAKFSTPSTSFDLGLAFCADDADPRFISCRNGGVTLVVVVDGRAGGGRDWSDLVDG